MWGSSWQVCACGCAFKAILPFHISSASCSLTWDYTGRWLCVHKHVCVCMCVFVCVCVFVHVSLGCNVPNAAQKVNGGRLSSYSAYN